MVTIRTASLTLSNSTFCPHSVCMCFVSLFPYTALTSYSLLRRRSVFFWKYQLRLECYVPYKFPKGTLVEACSFFVTRVTGYSHGEQDANFCSYSKLSKFHVSNYLRCQWAWNYVLDNFISHVRKKQTLMYRTCIRVWQVWQCLSVAAVTGLVARRWYEGAPASSAHTISQTSAVTEAINQLTAQ